MDKKHRLAPLMSKNSNEWETPPDFFEYLNSIYKFDVDLAASKENALCTKFYTDKKSALKASSWMIKGSTKTTCFCNPPYNKVKEFVEKINQQIVLASTKSQRLRVIFLVPARTDTKWFHEAMSQAQDIYMLKGRLRFGDGTGHAPFPSCIISWDSNYSPDDDSLHCHTECELKWMYLVDIKDLTK